MSNVIKCGINLSKVPQDAPKKSKKGDLFLNVCLVPTPDSQYGDDYMIVIDTPKGQKGAIVGNARFVGNKTNAAGDNNTKGIDNLFNL